MERKEFENISDFPPYFIGFNVTFEPGCRNNWHIHHGCGQTLFCVKGRGWYQEFGKEAPPFKNGDIVYIAPEIKHWQGAARDKTFTHLSLSVPTEDSFTQWREPVADEEYNRYLLFMFYTYIDIEITIKAHQETVTFKYPQYLVLGSIA
ncbi:cupin domain-containing protein [Caproiciproducens galactitolivorans]|uniref:cupin domain-containing protein n=1 Tax=Caproiciproducens galactitolivorans TaxID=642589 RepID=UPI0038B2EAE5